MSLKTYFQHLIIRLIGDKELEEKGNKEIFCLNCNVKFKSYIHEYSDGYYYDSLCKDCVNVKK
jgi:hypothetical protein